MLIMDKYQIFNIRSINFKTCNTFALSALLSMYDIYSVEKIRSCNVISLLIDRQKKIINGPHNSPENKKISKYI